jgi:hypothetical protein
MHEAAVAGEGRFCKGSRVIAGFQDAFVALCTDVRLRRDREATLARFRLDDRERAALRAIPADALDRYARSLIAKRWGELARVLPLTLRVAPRLHERYTRWALAHPATALDTVLAPGVVEALRAPLAALLCDEAEPPYAAELAQFEALRAASRADGHVRAQKARFAIHAIADDIARGLLPIDPDFAPTELRFERDRVRWRPA